MLSAKDLVSNLFHGTTFHEELAGNFKKLCFNHFGYKFVNDLQEVYQHFTFSCYTIFEDSSTYEEDHCYLTARDFAHFAKPTTFGLGKKEGLVIETILDGWVQAPNRNVQLEKLRVKEMKIHGYGKSWSDSQFESQLKENVYAGLKIPRNSMLKLLSENDMNSVIEKQC
jgi:hypothetical protein